MEAVETEEGYIYTGTDAQNYLGQFQNESSKDKKEEGVPTVPIVAMSLSTQ
jgi:hypothetical protein